LSGWSNRPPLTTTRRKLAAARRAPWPLVGRLGRHITDGTGVYHLAQSTPLQLLHRLEDSVLDLR
jgi:hypothetical protein